MHIAYSEGTCVSKYYNGGTYFHCTQFAIELFTFQSVFHFINVSVLFTIPAKVSYKFSIGASSFGIGRRAPRSTFII